LKKGHDEFELTRQPPKIRVCERRYHVNPAFADYEHQINPAGPCPGSPGFRPMRRPPQLTVAKSERRGQDPIRDAIESSNSEDDDFNSLSLPDQLFSDDVSAIRDGLY
jgi:murein L,D-transpeptidase YafK